MSAKWSSEQGQSKVVSLGCEFRNENQIVETGHSWGNIRFISGAVKQVPDKSFGASQDTLSLPLVRIVPLEYLTYCYMEATSQPFPHCFFHSHLNKLSDHFYCPPLTSWDRSMSHKHMKINSRWRFYHHTSITYQNVGITLKEGDVWVVNIINPRDNESRAPVNQLVNSIFLWQKVNRFLNSIK